ncbi:MAG: putative DNA binding domain-containing protein [Clostridiales Family XIII bacterium]|jgi:ATP-dependent DNA helicase RecG|nr:putative DNA binding domain-containing protein [Clostridiales Family XIII bacterium]
MDIVELLGMLGRGEDSRCQFKRNVHNADSLAADMAAFSNGEGGRIIIGVNDDGSIAGLDGDDVRRLNQLISNAASQCVQPPVNPTTQNLNTDHGLVMVLEVISGLNKPYQDKNGVFWVKNGADRRKASSREEIQRMFQMGNLIHADELPVQGATAADLDMGYFSFFFQKRFGAALESQGLPLQGILRNMNLLKGDFLNVAAVLLFAESPQYKLPAFIVKAGAFDDYDLSTERYIDSRDIVGRLSDVFSQTVSFVAANLRHVQGAQGVNSLGTPEIPLAAIEEIVANALIHRDYFISSSVRVFVFPDRVEIISPGHLPNNLTVENIKSGNSNARNAVLASFANHLLPYRGYGSGISRALACYPDIDFVDDRDGNMFKATMRRQGAHVRPVGQPDAGESAAGRPDAKESAAGRSDAGESAAGQPDAGESAAGRSDAGREGL